MRIEEYQPLAMRTSTEGHDRVRNGCLGLIGESGEIIDIIKKWEFQSGENPPFPKDKIIDECGDVLWYCAELATGLGVTLDELWEKLSDGFYGDLHPMNAAASRIDIVAARLCFACGKPFNVLFEPTFEAPMEWREAQAKAQIVGIMVTVQDILENCEYSLEEAMEANIAKLRKRYPDGFDPERSLHRVQ